MEQDVYEADDLIATYARQAVGAGADVTIISADKDLMQLVRPGVSMYDPASGEREERKIGREEVIAYFGAPPEKVVDIQALAGDSTDNVPGAPGIGVKTAAQLINEYGDLDTLIARAGEIKQNKRRETLTDPEVIEKVRLSKKLVRLVDDVKVKTPLDDLRLQQPDGKALVAFLKAMEFTTITRRVGEIFDVDVSAVEPDPAFVGRERLARPRTAKSRRPRPERPETAPAPRGEAAALTPAALADARAANARATPVEREKICLRLLARGAEELGRRGLRRRLRLFRHRDRFARSDAGQSGRRFAGAGAQPRLLYSARPPNAGGGRPVRRRRSGAGPASPARGARSAAPAPDRAFGGEDRAERQI